MIRLPPEGLVAFAAVIDEGGVSQAARALNLTQPAISNRMRSLQTIVGAPLYERRNGTTVPTEMGARLLPHARAVAHALDRASTDMGDTRAPVRIAISEAAAPVIAPRLARIAIAHPELDLELAMAAGTTIVDRLLAGQLDIGVTAAAPYGAGAELDRTVIVLDEILLLRAADNPVASPSDPIDLTRATVLWQAPTSGVRLTVERSLEAAGIEPERALELGGSPAALYSAAAGLGCCFASRASAQPAIDAGLLVAVPHGLSDLYARIEVVTQQADFLPEHQRRVREVLAARTYHEFE